MTKQQNKELYDALKHLRKHPQGNPFRNGVAEALYEIKTNENYKILMNDYDATWRDFLRQPEIDISISKADRWVKIWAVFVVELDLPLMEIENLDQNVLYRLSTVVDDSNINEWLFTAKNNTREEIYRKVRFGKVDEKKCKHNFKIKEIRVCRKCGHKETIRR